MFINSIENEIIKIESEVEKNYQSFRIQKIATKEDFKRNPYLTIGKEYSQYKDFNSYKEGFNFFKNVSSLMYLTSLLKNFKEVFGGLNKKALNNEFNEIGIFIKEAEKIKLRNAFINENDNNHHHEYLRLKYGYYQNKYDKYYSENNFYPTVFFSGIAVPVYAKYFLYKNWLQDKLGSTKNQETRKNITPVQEINIIEDEEFYLISLIKSFNIDNERINQILINRLGEIKRCKTIGANMAIIVLVGSILEGVLFGLTESNKKLFFLSKLSPKIKDTEKNKKIKDWTLENFIQVATDINFLKYSNTNAKNIQELRNLIHPYKESFEKDKINIHYRNNSLNDLKLVLEDLSRNLKN